MGSIFTATGDSGIAGIPPLVREEIAKDTTIRDAGIIAAQQSVAGEVARRNLVDAGNPLLVQRRVPGGDAVFAITDEAGNESWVGVTESGGLPDGTISEIGEAIGLMPDPRLSANGMSWTVIDEFGNPGDAALDEAGNWHRNAIEGMHIGLNPGRPIVFAGDSLSRGVGGGGSSYAHMVGEILNAESILWAVPGEASADIATRMGALTPTVTLTGNAIPADSTPVVVTSISPSDGWRRLTNPIYTGQIGTFTGTILGIPGTLKRDQSTDEITFTRDVSGTSMVTLGPVPIPAAGAKFYSSTGRKYRGAVHVIWAGRNNLPGSGLQLQRDMISMVAYVGQALVLSVINSSAEPTGSNGYNQIVEFNNIMASNHGDRYLDVRTWLIANGLATVGLTPTAQDTTDIGNGIIPYSLRSDSTHLNALGYYALAQCVAAKLRALGWYK